MTSLEMFHFGNPPIVDNYHDNPKETYIDKLMEDFACRFEDLPNAINDGGRWKKCAKESRAKPTIKSCLGGFYLYFALS